MHVLIVDDEEDFRDSLRDAFEDAGYEVATAPNGLEALTLLRSPLPVGLVILDLVMPRLTGDELYAEMQRDPRLAAIPVIIVTSDTTRAPAGVTTIRKPIDLSALLDRVAKHLRP